MAPDYQTDIIILSVPQSQPYASRDNRAHHDSVTFNPYKGHRRLPPGWGNMAANTRCLTAHSSTSISSKLSCSIHVWRLHGREEVDQLSSAASESVCRTVSYGKLDHLATEVIHVDFKPAREM